MNRLDYRPIVYRPRKAGVSADDYWRAVRAGQRESVLDPPAAMPPAVYEVVREVAEAFGSAVPALDTPDLARLRADLALWEREWADAEPEELPQVALSPMERRRLRPRVRPVPGPAKPARRLAPVVPGPEVRPPPGGAVILPRVLRALVETDAGAQWWSLQIAGSGASPAARAAYRDALLSIER
jgi:hypothetical protein